MSHLTRKEKELVAVGISVAAGCKRCTEQHVKAARRARADSDEIRQAISEAISVRSSATRMMENQALGQLGQHAAVVDYNGATTTTCRTRQLILIGAALAVNCTTNLERYLVSAGSAGVSDLDIDEVAKLVWIIKDRAASYVDMMVEAKIGPQFAEQEKDAAAAGGG